MCLQYSEGMHTIVSGSKDSSVLVWDSRMLRSVMKLTEHTDWIKRLRFDADKIISGSYDCTLKVRQDRVLIR